MPVPAIERETAAIASGVRSGGRAALLVIIAGLAAWYAVVVVTRPEIVGDEGFHLPVIQDLARGEWSALGRLPLPPTYHLLASVPARVWGATLPVVRGLNLVLAATTLVLYRDLVRQTRGACRADDLLRLAAQPFLFPLWVLAYTDVASLLAILGGLALHLRRRHVLAGGALLASVALRQSNVIWAAYFFALTVLEEWEDAAGADREPDRGRSGRRAPESRAERPTQALRAQTVGRGGRTAGAAAGRATRRGWPYLLVIFVTAVVLGLHGSPLVAFAVENQPRFNIAQLYVLGLSAGLIWLPVWLPQLGRGIARLPRRMLRPMVCAGLLAAIGLADVLFHNPHVWNVDPNYIRNWPLTAMTDSAVARYGVGAALAAALVPLFQAVRANAARRRLLLTWAFGLLFVAPHYLVEPRYYIIAFVLLDLFADYPARTARWLSAWYLLLCAAIGAFIVVRPGGLIGIW